MNILLRIIGRCVKYYFFLLIHSILNDVVVKICRSNYYNPDKYYDLIAILY